MMVRNKFLTISSLLLASSLLSACSVFSGPEEKIVTVTEVIKPTIPVVERPKPLNLNDVEFFVVTEDNLQDFMTRFSEENGKLVFVAMSIRGYEAMSLNMAELRRYILQQREVIIYYEKSVTEEKVSEETVVQ
jgi:hypothetical protein